MGLKSCWTGAALAALLTMLTPAAPARAQEDSSNRPTNSLHDGARALQFQFSDWTLRSLQGATLAYKWHFSDRSAWRIGVTVNLDFSDAKQVEMRADTVLNVALAGQDGQTVGLSWHYVCYPEHTGRLAPLFETGPYVALNHSHSKGTSATSTRSTSWNLGWFGAVGAEWFVTPSVSVMSEYGLGLAYVYQKASTDLPVDGRAVTAVSHAYHLDSLPITVGVSMYF